MAVGSRSGPPGGARSRRAIGSADRLAPAPDAAERPEPRAPYLCRRDACSARSPAPRRPVSSPSTAGPAPIATSTPSSPGRRATDRCRRSPSTSPVSGRPRRRPPPGAPRRTPRLVGECPGRHGIPGRRARSLLRRSGGAASRRPAPRRRAGPGADRRADVAPAAAATQRVAPAYRVIRRLHTLRLVSDDAMEAARQRYGSADYRAAQGIMRQVLVRAVNETYEAQLDAVPLSRPPGLGRR